MESSLTDEVPNYFNIFKCGRNILNRLDVTYERACMAATKDKYFEKILETLVDHNDHHNAPLSNEKLQHTVIKVVAETEEEECNDKNNNNNMNMDTFWKSPVTNNTQIKNKNVTNERRIYLVVLAETIKVFKGLTLQSKINNSAYYNSDEDDAESDTKSNQLVATHTSDGKKRKIADINTTNGNYPHILLINRIIP